MVLIDYYIIGHWTNRYQAQSLPHHFSTVETIWEKVDGGYHSKNFYRRDGANKPYRERYHKVNVISFDKLIFENYNLDWTRSENCDMIFTFDGEAWHGHLVGDKCTGAKGYKIVSEITLYGNRLHSMDQGYDDKGNMVWGSEGIYKFTRWIDPK